MSIDRTKLNKLRLALEALAMDERDRHMSAPEMQVFLWTAIQPGITQKEMAQRIEVSQSEVSRTVTLFSLHNGQGYGLLHAEEDPEYRKQKKVSLTPKGSRLAEQISELLR
jgi:DNA-binding MarR family transcriptional regulator